jgi:hypothetical protein
MSEAVRYQKCPHCGGEHWGQRFDDCPYVKILNDNSTTEQRDNSEGWLRNHKEGK